MNTATTLIIALIAAGGAIRFFWSKSKRREIRSFWDVVRNPYAMPNPGQIHKQIDETAQSLSGSSKKIAELVDYFVFEAKSSRDAWTEQRILAKLGVEVYPRALEILRDPSLKERLTVLLNHEYTLPEGPINRLCQLFDDGAAPSEEAATLLAPYLQSESNEIRKSTALAIGAIAAADSLHDLRRALADEEEYVRSYALMGIQRAIASGRRIEGSFQEQLFTVVANMWPEDTSINTCGKIPLILLKLDRDRAIKYLLSDELFSGQFAPVRDILEAFNTESVEVPRTRLLTIIADASKEPVEYPMNYVLEEALPLLGAHRNQKDLAMLQRFLDQLFDKYQVAFQNLTH